MQQGHVALDAQELITGSVPNKALLVRLWQQQKKLLCTSIILVSYFRQACSIIRPACLSVSLWVSQSVRPRSPRGGGGYPGGLVTLLLKAACFIFPGPTEGLGAWFIYWFIYWPVSQYHLTFLMPLSL
jgi:hypothetical protein